jgi:hypothetical protein
MGTVDMGADELSGTHPLEADHFELSETSGGVIGFSLNGGASNGGRGYLMLASVTGTLPGIPLPGGHAVLPLNWDSFTNMVLAFLNTPIFDQFMGTLAVGGEASATFNTLGPVYGMGDLTLSFAFALNKPWDFVSNPINILVVP